MLELLNFGQLYLLGLCGASTAVSLPALLRSDGLRPLLDEQACKQHPFCLLAVLNFAALVAVYATTDALFLPALNPYLSALVNGGVTMSLMRYWFL